LQREAPEVVAWTADAGRGLWQRDHADEGLRLKQDQCTGLAWRQTGGKTGSPLAGLDRSMHAAMHPVLCWCPGEPQSAAGRSILPALERGPPARPNVRCCQEAIAEPIMPELTIAQRLEELT
jgi:hypothetical protein